jgi:hypothetical protein
MTPLDFSQTVSGPAYGRTFRALASLMLLAVLLLGVRATLNLPDDPAAAQGYWLLGIGMLALVASYWVLIRSTTTIDSAGIRQSGLTEKKVTWNEMRSARLFGPPFARRLMVRTANGRFRFFFGGSPQLLDAFARIAQAYRQ